MFGNFGPKPRPTAGADLRQPLSLSGLDIAANETDATDSADYAARNASLVDKGQLSRGDATGRERQDRMNKSAVSIMNPTGRRFAQSLKNAGVDQMRTGAVAYGDQPGFFDAQNNRNLDQQSLMGLLAVKDFNGRRQ